MTQCVCGAIFTSEGVLVAHIRSIAEMQRSHFGRLTSYHAKAS